MVSLYGLEGSGFRGIMGKNMEATLMGFVGFRGPS